MVILLGSVALPLTNGFVGEFILIKSIFDYNVLAAFVAGLTMIFSAVYLFRFYGKAMFGKGDERVLASLGDLTDVEFSVMASLVVFVILLGIFPQPIIEMVQSSLKFIFTSMVK